MEPQLLTVVTKEELRTWPSQEWRNWQIEAKRDGFRLLIVDGIPQSRSGKSLHNIQHILDELGDSVNGRAIDGELHGNSWEETSHVARASRSERDIKLTYTIFDVLHGNEWKEQRCDRTLAWRQSRFSYFKETAHVQFVQPITVSSYRDFLEAHNINLQNGCDGTVLKLKASTYEFKRTKTWLKVKPVLDCDCLVVGMKEGTGKYKGMLGALEVLPEGAMADGPEQEDGPTTFVSGMDDEKRRDWWLERETKWSMIGKYIEVSYRKVNPSGKLVEPRFVRVRHDKNLT